jgi:hypothetical protein
MICQIKAELTEASNKETTGEEQMKLQVPLLTALAVVAIGVSLVSYT